MKRKFRVKKVPVVMQMEALECGAAALAMVLAYHGKWLPLEQVRRDCGVSRDGSNARDVAVAARNYGLDVKIYKTEPEYFRENDVFPCIIHWNFNHFVVLNGMKGDKAILNDPARGVVEVSADEFDRAFTGIVMILEPTPSFVADGEPKSMRRYAMGRIKEDRTAFVFIMITTLITALIGVINPVFSRVFMDRLLTGQNREWLIPFLVLLSAVALIQIVVQFVETTFRLKLEGKMAISANARFVWHVLRLPMEFFSQRRVADISSRQSQNEGIQSTLINTFAPLILQFGMLVFYLVVMIRYSLILTVIGLSSMLIKLITARYISKKRIGIMRVMMRDAGKLVSSTVTGIEMIETIKASGAEAGYFEQWSGYQASVNAQKVKQDRLNQFLGSVPTLVSSLADIVVLIVGIYLVMQGAFTVGMVFAFQGFLYSFISPADTLIAAGQTLQEMRTNMERVEDVMQYKPDVADFEDAAEDVTYKKLGGRIELKNITFGYSPLAEPLIRDFSLTITPGSRVALIGSSGCGKSTLSKIISGLYKPWSGEILFDGIPADDVPRLVKTGSIAVVDQEIMMFQDTIAGNIKLWDNSIEDFEMILAARDAQLHEDIMRREDGYNSQVLEGGRNFSGGQRQRMEIARVLAADPTILILDEATSALDARTEHQLVQSIADRGITCIVIAHRLSTIRDCDEIIVLDNGIVVERGTHETLMAGGGLYRELVASE